MKRISKFVALTCLAAVTASADTHYVNINNSTPSSPFTNWAAAATNIQAAINVATSNDTVLVTNGVYKSGGFAVYSNMTNRVAITKPITVRSVNGPMVTIIKGQGPAGNSAVRCVYVTNGAVLAGFTLTNGATGSAGDRNKGRSGGGVWCESTSAILSNCVLTGNSADCDGGGAYGGALYNCLLTGNSAASSGSGSGGGAYSNILYNCSLRGNSVWYGNGGGGTYDCTLFNCALTGNRSTTVGGGARNGTMYNCTLTDNNADYGGGGAYGGFLYNCIVYNNTSPSGTNYSGSTLNYCCTLPMPTSGVGNITTDPKFMNREEGVYRLLPESACIDAGNNADAHGDADLDGNPRIIHDVVDIGAYEYVVDTSTRYVSLTGGHRWPFANWATAATNIQTAIDAAESNDTVLVTNGVYDTGGKPANGALTNRVAIDKPIVVLSINGPKFTVIKGGGANGNAAIRCVYLGTNATLIGFTLTNGHTRTSSGNDIDGGGIFCEPSAVLSNCVLTGNSAYFGGGGANAGTLYNCMLTGNSASYGGGASACALYNCVLSGNSATNNGGGSNLGTLYNCTLSGNSASFGGGVHQGTLYNCIMYYNTAPNGSNYYGGTLNYCCTLPIPATGVGNITNEPGFVNRHIGDYHLIPGSACIDAGNNDYACGDVDLDGNPRTNVVVDIGAYEDVKTTTHYVSLAGGHRWPFADWATAATNIQAAIDAAESNDTVLVTNGVYDTGGRPANGALTNRVVINKPLVVRSVNGPEFTVIKGGGTNGNTAIRCVYLGTNATLIGFTLTNGHTWAANDVADGRGGGVFCESSAVLSNCILACNVAYDDGGGAWQGALYNCALSGNSASSGGGANYGTLYNCTLSSNSAASYGGGVSGGTLYNCTLTGNSASDSGGGARDGALYNCIVYFNKSSNGSNYNGGTLNYCCTAPMPSSGVGNITTDPGFVNAQARDYHLIPGSACIDAGNNAYGKGVVDLEGNPRTNGLAIDIGAYEYAVPQMARPIMVQDINFSADSSVPEYLTRIGRKFFFGASDNDHGWELWVSDGTREGTVMLEDINPDGDSFPRNLTCVSNMLYFTADDGVHGEELWKSDGTPAGTILVKDINRGINGSSPYQLTEIHGVLYFGANDGTNGFELWKSDGTTNGTVMVADIYPGNQSSWPEELTEMNGCVFFRATDSTNGSELWMSDGTSSNTVPVKDIYPGGGSSYPCYLTKLGTNLFFSATDPVNGDELWKSDGTSNGTVLVRDIYPRSGSSYPAYLTAMDGLLYFSANDGMNGNELWKSDGTTKGTEMVADIYPGSGHSYPHNLTAINGTLYFSARDNTYGYELWMSNGNVAWTVNPEINSKGDSDPYGFMKWNGTVYFIAYDSDNGWELRKITEKGIEIVAYGADIDFDSHPYLIALDDGLYFCANDGSHGWELWRSDGMNAGMLDDIRPGMLDDIRPSSSPSDLTEVNGTLFFSATTSASGRELWKSDGTEAGTILVTNICPGSVSSSPANLTEMNGVLYFTATSNGTNWLWKNDANGVSSVGNQNCARNPQFLTVMNGILFFGADGSTNGWKLWKSDGTVNGTVLVKDTGIWSCRSTDFPSYLTVVNGLLYFRAARQVWVLGGDYGYAMSSVDLWKSDGTANGTVSVKEINSDQSSWPHCLTALNGLVYFTAFDSVHGYELWKSDGTINGTVLVKDIKSNAVIDAKSSFPTNLTTVNNLLYFSANDGTNGRELWKSDGTSYGTTLVKDINPAGNADPQALTDMNGMLFFSAYTITNGWELWKSDGTSNGTVLVKDIHPSGDGYPQALIDVNGILYFCANDGVHGYELWKSDGTTNGTVMVWDVNPGSGGSNPKEITEMNGALYFVATDGVHGDELWRYPLTAVASPVITPATGTFERATSVTITCPTPGAVIRYTTDGTEPSTADAIVPSSGKLTISNTMLKARAFLTGCDPSAVATGEYRFVCATPVIKPDAYVFDTPMDVSVTCSTPGARVYCTTKDGWEPATNSILVTNGIIHIADNTTLKAKAFYDGYEPSAIAVGLYNMAAATPILTPDSGVFTGFRTVTISCFTTNAEIHYTTDGSNPARNSPIVTNGMMAITRSMTLRAQSFTDPLGGWLPSAVAIGEYTIVVDTPVITPNGGAFANPTNVSIVCATPGAEVYYTTDGSNPVKGVSTLLSPGGRVWVDRNMTLKAQAFLTNCEPSSVAVANFYANPTLVNLGSLIRSPYGATEDHPPIVRSVVSNAPPPAVYLSREDAVLCTEPNGVMVIDWWNATNGDYRAGLYMIQPVTNDVAIYHTELPSKAPTIDLRDTTFDVIVHPNSYLGTNEFWKGADGQLHAREKTGLAVIHYESGGAFKTAEVVEVRYYQPDTNLSVAIGTQLLPPSRLTNNMAVPYVARGKMTGRDDANGFIYQHNDSGTNNGAVFAVNATENDSDMEVFWMKKDGMGVAWPYEMRRYTADWPTNAQRYVRGHDSVLPKVALPAGLNAYKFPAEKFNNPTHYGWLQNQAFWTDGEGYSLLMYETGPAGNRNWIGFEVVQSVYRDNAVFNLTPTNWIIGQEITNSYHQGAKAGYIYTNEFIEPTGNRYHPGLYGERDDLGWTTGQVFAANESLLEVWWSNLDQPNSNEASAIQWPSLVARYTNSWPTNAAQIVIAGEEGTGSITNRNWALYYQNDPTLPGFNPNDEHALVQTAKRGGGQRIFALRNDLGRTNTSEPFVLMTYDQSTNGTLKGMKVYKVVTDVFSNDWTAGLRIQPPHPLAMLSSCNESYTLTTNTIWRDRQSNFWAKAAGNGLMRFYYPVQEGFYFPPDEPQPALGDAVPWLSGGSTGEPVNVTYGISWPTNGIPTLYIGETLAEPKQGLPQIWGQTSVEVIYQQAKASGEESVKLIDPLRTREVEGVILPDDVETTLKAGEYYFPKLPPQLRNRLSYNPTDKNKLKFKGQLVKPAAGEYYLLLNVITPRETDALLHLSEKDSTFGGKLLTLINDEAKYVLDVLPNMAFDNIALTAGAATGPGYVTLAFNNSTKLNQPSDPISLSIIMVTNSLYKGEIKIVDSDNVFDEKLTLRHSGDFAGLAENYVFEWQRGEIMDDGTTNWSLYTSDSGALDITLSSQDPPQITLKDNYFMVRYHSTNPAHPCGTNWSEWTEMQLAEGWIKRVLAGINPFEQRIKSFDSHEVNKIVSMIAQAGRRSEGDVALNTESANTKGLIEIYETVLKRGMDMSINVGYNDGPANAALLLAAGRIADLYTLLGNEAYADATDPTIGFGTDDGQYGAYATSIHCFQNQTASLLEEELGLLRGRDDSLKPSVHTQPFYNRLIWNFTRDIVGGEVAYVLNYEIQDKVGEDGDTTPDGFITEDDAAYLYPQGHGDAWGHYLTAIQKGYYRLLQHTNYTWTPRIESVIVGGMPVEVDYFDERKFASVAAAKAQTGAEVVNLTYRSKYVEDPAGQWQGYCDSNTNRAWGLSEWACRAGLGSLYDWVAANSMLPASSTNSGIQKIDRTTILDLREIANAHEDIQEELDKADMGLNPLGLAKNVVPFDIDPTQIDQGKTHFEQIYSRAALAMNNAVTVFNYAQNASQLLRRQSDTVENFQQTIDDREADFNSRLIESFGYPYADDIGPGETYPTGYNGPDIYHFAYMDPSELVGTNVYNDSDGIVQLNINFKDLSVGDDGALIETTVPVTFNLSTKGFGLVKPYNWTGQRRAPGEIQMAQSDMVQANARFQKAIKEYENLIRQMEDQAALLAAQYNLNANEIRILNQGLNTQRRLDSAIFDCRSWEQDLRRTAVWMQTIGNAVSDAIPQDTDNPMNWVWAGIRSGIRVLGDIAYDCYTGEANKRSLNELDFQQTLSEAQTLQNIQLTSLRDDYAVLQSLKQLEQSVRQEVTLRLEIYTQQEALQQMAGRYLSALSKGQRLLDDRLRFRQQTAAKLQSYRYKDMAFRIFRNDSLQKYRAQFDLASRYVYLAAKAYDYETNLRKGDSRGPGDAFMTQIIRARTIGMVGGNGEPQTGGSDGDGGLADPMARMSRNWEAVLKSQLGFNNPDTETGRFSLRTELFRILPNADGDKRWEETLERAVVDNVLDLPEFRQYCLPFYPQQAEEPAIVIPFATGIYFGQNFFGWPAGGGDNTYNSANFATKVRSVGVWFANYNNIQGGGLINTPHVYLVPVGMDIMRSPTDRTGAFREWKVLDQVLPAPFALSEGDLDDPEWIPINDTLVNFASCRRIGPFRAYHDSGAFNVSETINNSRLIGRSVWNTRWLLIIPAGSLHSDREEGLARFIHGAEMSNGQRDGNGVKDIKLFFQTYSYAGY
jgi:ELWxxDGT repeat protein